MRSWIRLSATLLVVSIGTETTGCGDEKAVSPAAVKYNLYIDRGGTIFVLDADSLTITDSIFVAESSRVLELLASPDGRWLYAEVLPVGVQNPFTAEIDLSNRTVSRKSFEWTYSDLVLCQQGRTLVREASRLQFIDIASWSITEDTLPIRNVEGATNSDLIGGRLGLLPVVYDVKRRKIVFNQPILSVSGASVAVSRVLPMPDGKRILTKGGYFMITNLVDGKTVFEHPIFGGEGQIAITPDGSHALVASHGEVHIGDSHGTLDIFDLVTPKHVAQFSDSDFGWPVYPVAHITFIPGTTRAFVSVPWSMWDPIWELDWKAARLVRKSETKWSGPIAAAPSTGP